jgi:pSer/pThr/pTyr-binding forkhead associated (FHA) protein
MSPGTLVLEVVAGNAPGTEIEVEEELLIGRQATGAGTLGEDVEISRRHAQISRDADGAFVIEDLGSTNGTFVNGERIEAPTRLGDGDRIEVGATTLTVVLPTAESPLAIQPTAERALPGAPAAVPPLSLRIEVDMAGRVAVLALDDDSDSVRLEYADGGWRIDRDPGASP